MNEKKSRVICIVDDDGDVRDSTRVLLESSGFVVRDYPSAGEFLKSSINDDIGCLLLDLHMPGMTGLELLENLRARNIQTPAIIVTANDDKLTARVARAGVLKTLRKPVDDSELLLWVESALAGNSKS